LDLNEAFDRFFCRGFSFLRGRYGWIWMDEQTIGAVGGGWVWWQKVWNFWKNTGGVAEVKLGKDFQAGKRPRFLALAVPAHMVGLAIRHRLRTRRDDSASSEYIPWAFQPLGLHGQFWRPRDRTQVAFIVATLT
jgi:hypothetical protein